MTAEKIINIPVFAITPDPYQARQDFSPESLEELAQSIKNFGVLQPILVKALGNNTYQLIAGERRWRAAILAELETIPAIVQEESACNELTERLKGLVENLQRENLNAIEEAQAYQAIIAEYQLTQEDLATYIGKNRSSITNALRLLNLPELVQNLILENKLSAGHGKLLLSLTNESDQLYFAHYALEHDLSVQELDKLLKTKFDKKNKAQTKTMPEEIRVSDHEELYLRDLSEKLSRQLGTGVSFSKNSNGTAGQLQIDYYSQEELAALIELLEETQ